MRGHNIVADGWAGSSNPHPHPNPPPTFKPAQEVPKLLIFSLLNSMAPDGSTDQWTDRWTKPLYSCVSATRKTEGNQ